MGTCKIGEREGNTSPQIEMEPQMEGIQRAIEETQEESTGSQLQENTPIAQTINN